MIPLLAVVAAALFACGTYLLLARELTRVLIGLALIAHGANALLLNAARGPGAPTFAGGSREDLLDPFPQAFALTAIVITFGVSCFLLALAYRSWVLSHDDAVHDDAEDRRVMQGPLDDEAPVDEEPVSETAR